MHLFIRWPAQADLPSRSVTLLLALTVLVVPGAAMAQRTGLTSLALSVRGDWLQANSSLSRSTLPSNALSLALETDHVTYSVGFARIARNLSTIEGGTAGAEVGARSGQFHVSFGISALVGRAMASMDTTGYDYVNASGQPGHTPRYDYSTASAVGIGETFTLEYDIGDKVGVRLTGAQWSFSGAPLGREKTRATLGVGVIVPLFGKLSGRMP
jgi:hypothetical protein